MGLRGPSEPPLLCVRVGHRAPGRVPTQPIRRMHPLQMPPPCPTIPQAPTFFLFSFFPEGGHFVYTAITGFNSGQISKAAAAAAGGRNQEPQSFTKNTDFIGRNVHFVFCFFMFYIYELFFSISCDQFPPFFTLS